MSNATGEVSAVDIKRARFGVLLQFGMSGLCTGAYLARIPSILSELGLDFGKTGVLLFAQAITALSLVPIVGVIARRIGVRRPLWISAGLYALAYALIGTSSLMHSVMVYGFALATFGAAVGMTLVPQNIESASVEHHSDRPIMPLFHGAYSVGCVSGALIGMLTSVLHVPLAPLFFVIAAMAAVVRVYSTHLFLPDRIVLAEAAPKQKRHTLRNAVASSEGSMLRRASGITSSLLRSWIEPRTLLIGLIASAVALSENAANSWIAVGVVDSFGTPEAYGGACLVLFLLSMAVGRLAGCRILDSFGRPAVLRTSATLAVVGLIAFALSPSVWGVLVGIVCWGSGSALMTPISISAASDDPIRAGSRISVVSTFSNASTYVLPPLLGMLANVIGMRFALGIIALPMIGVLLIARVTKPIEPTHAEHTQKVRQSEPAIIAEPELVGA